MKEFMSYLRPYRRDGILAAFCIVTETIFELVIPLVMASIVDVGVANGDRRYILAKGAQMILFALIALILGQGSAIFPPGSAMGWEPNCAGRSLPVCRNFPLQTPTILPPLLW